MEDVLRDLARAKPATPEVDSERMERDLARIVAMPRPARTRTFVRRFAPLVVAVAVIALAVVLLPRPAPVVRPAAPPQRWHMLQQIWTLKVVGDPANPYVVRFDTTAERWLADDSQVNVYQKNGMVAPFSPADDAKWETAGKPATAPLVGRNQLVRIGPMQTAVEQKAGSNELTTFEAMPTDLMELKKSLEAMVAKDAYGTASLAMEMMTANVRDDQRKAAFELLRTLDGVRFLDHVNLPNDRYGIGVAIAAPPTFQFSGIETQLVINPETLLPVFRRDVLTTPQHGLPVDVPISEVQYLLLERTTIDPILPNGVPVNGEVQSPVIDR